MLSITKSLLIILIDRFIYPYYILDYNNIPNEFFYTDTIVAQLGEVFIEENAI